MFILDCACLTVYTWYLILTCLTVYTCYLILTSCSTHHRLTSGFNVYPSEYPYVFGLIDWCLTSNEQYSWGEQFTNNKSCKLTVTMGWVYWWMLLMPQNHGKGGWWIRSDYFALQPEVFKHEALIEVLPPQASCISDTSTPHNKLGCHFRILCTRGAETSSYLCINN